MESLRLTYNLQDSQYLHDFFVCYVDIMVLIVIMVCDNNLDIIHIVMFQCNQRPWISLQNNSNTVAVDSKLQLV